MAATGNRLRVLGRVRLSRDTEESTSVKRQREVIEQYAELHGHVIAGWAEDLDVSGSVNPFETPSLGTWLSRRADEFDAIVAWKLDRVSRSSIGLNRLAVWCDQHCKNIVSATEAIDLSTPIGRLIFDVVKFLAEGELEAIRERQRGSRARLNREVRWPGGTAPFGYRPAPLAGGGYRLEPCPHATPIVRRIVDAVLDGRTLFDITTDLNTEGVPAPRDFQRICAGRDDTGSSWLPLPTSTILTNQALRGVHVVGGIAQRDDTGDLVRFTDRPIATDEEFDRIQAVLDSAPKRHQRRPRSLVMAGLLRCWSCDSVLESHTITKELKSGVREYKYYRCTTAGCGARGVPAESAHDAVETKFLTTLGEEQVTDRVWIPGNDVSEALSAAVAAVDALLEMLDTSTSPTVVQRVQQRLAVQELKIKELEEQESHSGRYGHRPTGQTYRELWDKTPESERGALLRRHNLRVRIGDLGRDGGGLRVYIEELL